MRRIGLAARLAVLAVPIIGMMILGDAREGMASNSRDRTALVVAKVGNNTITVGDLERRMGALPADRLLSFGSTPDERKRNYLERVLIPEQLFLRGAQVRGIDRDPAVRAGQLKQLRGALQAQLRDETLAKTKISDEEVAAYYKDNISNYQSEALVSVWRILVPDRPQAQQIIKLFSLSPKPQMWLELSRKHSIDTSTNLRGGNLGFLNAAGVSSDGKTQVSENIVEAAMRLRDGEIVREPVPEGSGFAVVWRRGSKPSVSRSLEDESMNIRQTLQELRVRDAYNALLERLRNEHARVLMPNGAELITVQSGGELGQPDKPGRVVRRPGKPTPLQTPQGLR